MTPPDFLTTLQQLPLGNTPDLAETLQTASSLLAPFPKGMNAEACQASTVQALVDALWLGPLDPFLRDPRVQNVIVPGPGRPVLVERDGVLSKTEVQLSEAWLHFLYTLLRRKRLGQDPTRFTLDAIDRPVTATCDFLRYTAVGRRFNTEGPLLYLRRHPDDPWTLERFVEAGAMTPLVADFLRLLVQAQVNLFVVGGSSAGKTSLVTALLQEVPEDEWLVVIEEKKEIRLPRSRWAYTSAELDFEDPEVTLSTLLTKLALQVGPKRIVMGETKGGEAFEVLQAMNVGHEGSISTVHATGVKNACRRIQECALQSPVHPPEALVQKQIDSAHLFLVYITRGLDGRRRVTEIAAVDGATENGTFVLNTHFAPDASGMAVPTSHPLWEGWFAQRLKERGLKLPGALLTAVQARAR